MVEKKLFLSKTLNILTFHSEFMVLRVKEMCMENYPCIKRRCLIVMPHHFHDRNNTKPWIFKWKNSNPLPERIQFLYACMVQKFNLIFNKCKNNFV